MAAVNTGRRLLKETEYGGWEKALGEYEGGSDNV